METWLFQHTSPQLSNWRVNWHVPKQLEAEIPCKNHLVPILVQVAGLMLP